MSNKESRTFNEHGQTDCGSIRNSPTLYVDEYQIGLKKVAKYHDQNYDINIVPLSVRGSVSYLFPRGLMIHPWKSIENKMEYIAINIEHEMKDRDRRR